MGYPLVTRYAVRALNGLLGLVERAALALGNDRPSATIWIIGAPRSGTTLLYQLLVQGYHLGHFTNFASQFYQAPAVALWIESRLMRPPSHSAAFVSKHGRTQGRSGPSEATAFWYRWFPRGDHVYVPAGAIPSAQLTGLRREVAAMSRVAHAPMLFKNTFNSMRIAPILEAFPQGRFLVCQRNPVDTAQSILQGRMDRTGSKEEWWSLPPKEIDVIRTHPYWEQVVEQVYYTDQQIHEDAQRFGPEHFFQVSYEQLCQNTRETLGEVEAFLQAAGIPMHAKGPVPAQFPISTGQKVDDLDYRRIVERVNQLWA